MAEIIIIVFLFYLVEYCSSDLISVKRLTWFDYFQIKLTIIVEFDDVGTI